MSSFKCYTCNLIFSSRNSLSKHMFKCLGAIKDVLVIAKSAKSFCKSSFFDELPQDDLFDINEDQLDIGYSSKTFKKLSFKDINFSNPVQTINLKSNIVNLSNDDNLSENLADIFFELEDNTYSKNLEVNPNTNILDEFKNTSQGFRELSDDISVSTDYFEDIGNNLSDDKNQEYDEFSNEAYANLMVLVTKYKLRNAAGNAIISFFNKHSNHSKSLLPKNIKQEKLFMNNMKSNLLYKKTKVLDYDNTEYFLYHMLLMSCIQNILEISNISQTFALEYEELYKTTKLYSIYLLLGNMPTWHRNRQDTKQLLGYLPIIKSSNIEKEIKRQLFHKCLDIILEPIQSLSEKGTNLLLNNKFIWFYPKFSTIIADWPEAATFCLTYKSTKSKHLCHFCLVKRDNLTNTNLIKKDIELRNHENMQYYYNRNEEQIVSIESVQNIFWKFK
ncbi:zn-finger domain-containing protein [Gigaspora margarita]|uniref:Zn-finger domain-containing protein n=1 Tax=Gigaspora margarita TaxID=4874 RepID=A0A8H4AAY9_GIGMA|nr:zn-finger domain-containing protein [Gigaspora margarita]